MTEKQKKIYKEFITKKKFYKCPKCNVEIVQKNALASLYLDDDPNIVQIYCGYGCGFLFLNNYIKNSNGRRRIN